MRIATIDIGTNTAQLLVVEVDNTTLHRVHAAERFVRLGEGVDGKGRIRTAALDRLLSTLQEHVQTAGEHDVDHIVAAGTSALRDARNRQAVLDAVQNEVGLAIDLLSGEEEAAWSFAAACASFDDLTGPCLVVDVGGGSTELIAGTDPSSHHPRFVDAITDRVSLNIGCVRLTERCFPSHPPSQDEIDRAQHLIDTALQQAPLDVGRRPSLIGTAGTATALALVHAGPDSTWDALHGGDFVLFHAEVRHWRDRLLQCSVEEILSLHPIAMNGRADVFSVGVLLLERLLVHRGRDSIRVSPYELRHGLALRWLASSPETPTETTS